MTLQIFGICSKIKLHNCLGHQHQKQQRLTWNEVYNLEFAAYILATYKSARVIGSKKYGCTTGREISEFLVPNGENYNFVVNLGTRYLLFCPKQLHIPWTFRVRQKKPRCSASLATTSLASLYISNTLEKFMILAQLHNKRQLSSIRDRDFGLFWPPLKAM